MGILLLIMSIMTGYCLIKQLMLFSKPVVSFCGATLIGCLLSGTVLYVFDYFFVVVFQNYFAGTIIFLIGAAIYIIYSIIFLNVITKAKAETFYLLKDKAAVGCFFIFAAFSVWLCFHSLSLTSNSDILVGGGAWSDIMYHHSYVRSVAIGNNIPIQYPYFANETIHYHFLFDYYAGKISQLGLNSVIALNIMSIIGMLCLLMLIFEFGKLLFNSTLTGFLGAVFLIFHGSYSAFSWMGANLTDNFLQKVIEKKGSLNGAPFEDWTLFNLNIFINQRYLPFTLALLILLASFIFENSKGEDLATNKANWFLSRFFINKDRIRILLLWVLVIGCLPYWNILIPGICIIFLGSFAILNYKNKRFFAELMFIAFLSFLVVLPQLILFKSGSTVLADYPRFHFGYALSNPTLIEFVLYYFQVLGFKLLLVFATLLILSGRLKLHFLVFLIPFVTANVFQLGVILYDNNKLILVSLIFINCYAAYFIAFLVRKHRFHFMLLAVALILCVTLAGIIDFFAVKNIGQVEIADSSSKLKDWLINNTSPKSVFLTDDFIPFSDNAISTINLSGRLIYAVSNCVATSCDVNKRTAIARKLYSFEGGIEQVKSLIRKEKIDYVVIDELVRKNTKIKLNESAFAENFSLEYHEQKTDIYKINILVTDTDFTNNDDIVSSENAFVGGQGENRGQFKNPRGVTVDIEGNIYVADTDNSRIQKFSTSGKFISIFGNTGNDRGKLHAPNGIAIDSGGNIYVTDASDHRLIKFKADGSFEREWSGPAPGFYGPRDVEIDLSGNIYVIDQGRARVVKLNSEGGVIREWGRKGAGEGELDDPTGLAVSEENVYVADAQNARIQVFDLDGNFLNQWSVPEWQQNARLFPDVVFDSQANQLYATSANTSEIFIFNKLGERLNAITLATSNERNSPVAIALSNKNSEKILYVLSTFGERVSIINLSKTKKSK